jgi:hypothetical protein
LCNVPFFSTKKTKNKNKSNGNGGIKINGNKAKQVLAKMVLKTKWEAYFEPNFYEFRLC